MRRSFNDGILCGPIQFGKVSHISRNADHQPFVILRMLLRLPESRVVDHIDLDMLSVMVEIGFDYAFNDFQSLLSLNPPRVKPQVEQSAIVEMYLIQGCGRILPLRWGR